eukprot:GHVH01017449.1.p1 GENE.GHVH01017449.1~~GHVH01017449.1.p1  ORF type:complete len:554 (+),score=50.57 GHVH01017449.1:222-1883(+)
METKDLQDRTSCPSRLTLLSPATNLNWTDPINPRALGYWRDGKELKCIPSGRTEPTPAYSSPTNVMFISPRPPRRSDSRTFLQLETLNSNTSYSKQSDILSTNSRTSPPETYKVDPLSDRLPANNFPYPTWSLLGQNSCRDLRSTHGIEGVGRNVLDLDTRIEATKRIQISERARPHSQPPACRNAKVAQRSSHSKILYASRRCRSIGRSKGVLTNNQLRPRHTRGDDFRSLELIGVPAEDASFSIEEKEACRKLFRQDTRSLSMKSTGAMSLRSPMDHPYFIWTLFMGNQSPLSRIKLLNMLAAAQLNTHICHDNCSLPTCHPMPKKRTDNLTLLSGSHSVKRIGKKYNEDAVYSPDDGRYSHYRTNFFVIADGVGEWAQYGINSSVFSNSVVDGVSSYLAKGTLLQNSTLSEDRDPVKCTLIEALWQGHRKANDPLSPVFGGSTILAGLMSHGNQLCTTNVGDCAVIQLRRDPQRRMRFVVVKKSTITQHQFNTPKQFINCPGPEHYAKMEKAGQYSTVEKIKDMRMKAEMHGCEITSDLPTSVLAIQWKE